MTHDGPFPATAPGGSPRPAAEPATIDAALFRQAMRLPACAVAVVAAGLPGNRAGITATAVCSLSDAPPSVLACVHRSSRFHGVITRAHAFSISYLAADQVSLAEVFAGRTGLSGDERFDPALWTLSALGAPMLVGALAAFSCHLERIVDHATHALVIGRVDEIEADPPRPGLVYSQGAFQLPQPIG